MATNLATALAIGGERDAEALALLEKTLDDEEAWERQVFPLLTDRQRRTYLATHRWTLGAYLSVAARLKRPAGVMYERLLRCKAASFTRNVQESAGRARLAAVAPGLVGGVFEGAAAAHRDAIAAAAREAVLLRRLLSGDVRLVRAQAANFEGCLRDIDRHLQALGCPSVAAHALPLGPMAEGVAAGLPGDHALIDYFEIDAILPGPLRPGTPCEKWTERRYVAFVVTRGGVRGFETLAVSSAEVGTRAGDWLARISRPDAAGGPAGAEAARTAGLSVRQAVWDPVARHFGRANITHVILAPDGALWRLPYAALPSRDNPRGYLIEEVVFGHVLSGHQVTAQVGPALPRRPGPARRVLVVGDIEYDGRYPPVACDTLLGQFVNDLRAARPGLILTSLTKREANRRKVLDALSSGQDHVLFCGHCGLPDGEARAPAGARDGGRAPGTGPRGRTRSCRSRGTSGRWRTTC